MLKIQMISGLMMILLSFPSLGAEKVRPEAPINMICVTEIPSTSFEATQSGDMVRLRVLHHNGPQYAPITNSYLTPSDVASLQAKAETILKLGDKWNIEWRRSGCNADSAMFFQCIGEAKDLEINGIKVHPWAFTVTDVTEKTMWGTYKRTSLSLRFDIEKVQHEITMTYQPGECVELGTKAADPLLRKISSLSN